MPKDGKKSIYDDSKIESHSAITPTLKIPEQASLSEKEWKVYSTIFNRFLAVFCSKPCTVLRTAITIDVGELERFKLTGDVYLAKGWMLKNVYRGELSVQDSVDQAFTEIQTLFAGVKEINLDSHAREQVDSIGICPVCGDLIKEGRLSFFCRNKDCPVVFFKDNKLLGSIGKRMSGSMVKQLLTNGAVSLKNCKSMKSEKTFDCILTVHFEEDGKPVFDMEFPSLEDNAVGQCPKCGGLVVPERFGNFSCMNWKQGCKYTIPGKICGKKLTKSNAKLLLSKGKTGEIKGFTSKAGKTFHARLVLEENGKDSFLFEKQRRNI